MRRLPPNVGGGRAYTARDVLVQRNFRPSSRACQPQKPYEPQSQTSAAQALSTSASVYFSGCVNRRRAFCRPSSLPVVATLLGLNIGPSQAAREHPPEALRPRIAPLRTGAGGGKERYGVARQAYLSIGVRAESRLAG